MTIKEIILDYLTKNGFDGLLNSMGACGCPTEDLMPCTEPSVHCEAGYKGPCTCGEGCDFAIYREKPKPEDTDAAD